MQLWPGRRGGAVWQPAVVPQNSRCEDALDYDGSAPATPACGLCDYLCLYHRPASGSEFLLFLAAVVYEECLFGACPHCATSYQYKGVY